MRFPVLPLLIFSSAITLCAQAPQANRAAAAKPAAPQVADPSGVDTIIALVKGNMSESLVLKTIQRQNKTYDLAPEDLVKLQKAGVSETIINAMLDPSSISATPAAAAATPTAAPAPAAQPSAPPPVAAAPAPAPNRAAAPQNNLTASAKPGASSVNCAPATSGSAAPAAPKSGIFSSFKSKMKQSAQTAVDGVGNSVNCAAAKGAEGSQAQVGSAVDNATALPTQKVNDATVAANKATTGNVDAAVNKANNTTTTATNATTNATAPPKAPAAPTAARRGATK